MSDVVLDASAVLAIVFNEPGAAKVRSYLTQSAAICSVNLAEVGAACVDHGGTDAQVKSEIDDLGMDVVDFDEYLAMQSAFLRRHTRHHGLSLGDRACLATAMRLGAKVLTADRHWKGLKVGVEIEFVR